MILWGSLMLVSFSDSTLGLEDDESRWVTDLEVYGDGKRVRVDYDTRM